ncbi:hypothetical protein Hanom_Chr00s163074g01825891 [Helianthus anomalus]
MIFNRCCSTEVNNVTVLRLIADVWSLLGCLIVVNAFGEEERGSEAEESPGEESEGGEGSAQTETACECVLRVHVFIDVYSRLQFEDLTNNIGN